MASPQLVLRLRVGRLVCPSAGIPLPSEIIFRLTLCRPCALRYRLLHKVDVRLCGIRSVRFEMCTTEPNRKPKKFKYTMYDWSECMKHLCPLCWWTEFHTNYQSQQ